MVTVGWPRRIADGEEQRWEIDMRCLTVCPSRPVGQRQSGRIRRKCGRRTIEGMDWGEKDLCQTNFAYSSGMDRAIHREETAFYLCNCSSTRGKQYRRPLEARSSGVLLEKEKPAHSKTGHLTRVYFPTSIVINGEESDPPRNWTRHGRKRDTE